MPSNLPLTFLQWHFFSYSIFKLNKWHDWEGNFFRWHCIHPHPQSSRFNEWSKRLTLTLHECRNKNPSWFHSTDIYRIYTLRFAFIALSAPTITLMLLCPKANESQIENWFVENTNAIKMMKIRKNRQSDFTTSILMIQNAAHKKKCMCTIEKYGKFIEPHSPNISIGKQQPFSVYRVHVPIKAAHWSSTTAPLIARFLFIYFDLSTCTRYIALLTFRLHQFAQGAEKSRMS